ncbi:MAG: CBS domain-containing protein [Candidatus Hodarchaeota archaeon]
MAYTVLEKEPFEKISIDADKTIAETLHKMNKERLLSLLVVKEGKIVGIITEREIKSRVLNTERDPEQSIVSEVMSPLGEAYIVMPRIPVGDLASKPLIMDVEDRVTDAIPKMREIGMAAVIVTKKGKPVGVFTFHDVIDKVWGLRKAEETPIGEVMSPVVKITSSQDIVEATKLMKQNQVIYSPVMYGEKIVGLLSSYDLIKYLSKL